MNIQTNNNVNTYNKASFGATILDNVTLRKKTLSGYKTVEGFVSQLTKDDAGDIARLQGIKENWRKSTIYSNEIIDNFCQNLKKKNFYITELKDNCVRIKNRICCMMQTTDPTVNQMRDKFRIDLLQSAPAIANKGSSSKIKGAGELAVYEAVKVAKKEGYQKVDLYSTNNSFYQKIGFEKNPKSNFFSLDKSQYDKFLSRIEQKYNIQK